MPAFSSYLKPMFLFVKYKILNSDWLEIISVKFLIGLRYVWYEWNSYATTWTGGRM